MFVWIVWGEAEGLLAAFSSEQRARAFILRHDAEAQWACHRVCVNVEDGFQFGASLQQQVSARATALN